MTARGLLRDMAELCDGLGAQYRAKGNLDGVVECDRNATALRTLADRLDAEMDDACAGGGYGDRGQVARDLIARLDAPLDVDPNSTQQNQALGDSGKGER